MIRQNDMGTVRDADSRKVDPTSSQCIHLLEHNLRAEGNTVADDTMRALEQDARRHQAELIGLTIDDDRMAGIAAALETDDRLSLLGQIVYDLALAFVAPLGTGNYYC